ncbi:hypothetical protein [Streptomyces fuscichromogenes]|uniref:Uncharacterized protein n=1 Tax=Streptomyces fuscichromogenes TaxID=1324013 RepID=A0A917XMZ8_9ACTN|nr:hypothetical protein [Streptomyces fuscichromogenes]GGN41950.1 hypothetical protein GCM10011578_090800 [Streptomyces fuscichromogenes]
MPETTVTTVTVVAVVMAVMAESRVEQPRGVEIPWFASLGVAAHAYREW